MLSTDSLITENDVISFILFSISLFEHTVPYNESVSKVQDTKFHLTKNFLRVEKKTDRI